MRTRVARWISFASASALILATASLGCRAKKPEAEAKTVKEGEKDGAKTHPAGGELEIVEGEKDGALAPLPEVIATVGSRTIPRKAFEDRYIPEAAKILERRDDGKVPATYEAMQRDKLIDGLIWTELMALEAERLAVDFTPEALAAEETRQRAHIPDWTAWLARVGQTPELRRAVTVDYLRERVLLENRFGPIAPTDEALRAAFDVAVKSGKLSAAQPMARASHFLVAYGPRTGDEKIQPVPYKVREATDQAVQDGWKAKALDRAKALRALALAPDTDFNDFAREYSEGPGAFRGGDMGLFPRTQMVKGYADAAFTQDIGALSEPVESDKGYYVIKVFGRYEAGPLPFEAVRADLVRQLEGEKIKTGRAALRKELEERFTVTSKPRDAAREFRAKAQADK